MSSYKASNHKGWGHKTRHALAHSLAHSLRMRLMLLFVLLALAMTAIFLAGMQNALSRGWRDAALPLVADYIDRLAAEVGSPPSVARAQALSARLPIAIQISGPVVNWRSDAELQRSVPWPKPRRWQRDGDAGDRGERGEGGEGVGGSWRGDEVHLLERVTADGHLVQFGLSVPAMQNRPRVVGWVTLAVLLTLTALAYARVRRMLRPLDDIRAGALRFGQGDFAQPIPVRHVNKPDELGELAATINTMAGDIHQMLDAKRALLLAISHELRSPLTRARLNTELLPETPELQASREALMRDLGLMRDLIADLLESERLASAHAALQREPTDVVALVQEVINGLRLSSAQQAPLVDLQVSAELPLLALDRTRVRLLVRNLLDNALRHSQDASHVPCIQLELLPPGALASGESTAANADAAPHLIVGLTVRDYGTGVPEDQLAKLAQPFYRPEAARTRETGGVGLGLYLCKLVAQAHGGTWSVRNAQPGLEVSVTLVGSVAG